MHLQKIAGEAPVYGQILRVVGLPRRKMNQKNVDEIALNHSEMRIYLRMLKNMGYDLVVDTTLQTTNLGAYMSGVGKYVAISAETPWPHFLHEFWHARFDYLVENLSFERLQQHLANGQSLRPLLTFEMRAAVGEHNLRRLEVLIQSGLPKRAVDETMAFEIQMNASAFKTSDRYYKFIFRYSRRHQISELRNLSARKPNQQARLYRAVAEWALGSELNALSILKTRSLTTWASVITLVSTAAYVIYDDELTALFAVFSDGSSLSFRVQE